MVDVLQEYQVKSHDYRWQPRGLINRGNMCYLNAILHPLLYSQPLYQLLDAICHRVPHHIADSPHPLIDSMVMFMQEFRRRSQQQQLQQH